MKTAVIISGQARSFARCLPNLAWAVFSKLENPNFFCSVAKDADASSVEMLRVKYPAAPVHIEVVEQPTLSEPPMIHTLHAPYSITPTQTPGVGPLQGIMRQLWHLSRAYKFAVENGAGECEVFVRCRPDLNFHRFKYMRPAGAYDAFTPWFGNYGGVNDRFAILGTSAARHYFETYDRIPSLLEAGCPFHPESLVCASLEAGGVSIWRGLTAEFAVIRKDGEWVHMQATPQEMCEFTASIIRTNGLA